MVTVTVAPGSTFRHGCTRYAAGETVDVNGAMAEAGRRHGVFV